MATGNAYVVSHGDDLIRIAASVYGDMSVWREIAALNGIRDPWNLRLGQVIRLP